MNFFLIRIPIIENMLKKTRNTTVEKITCIKKPALYGSIKTIMAPKEAKEIRKTKPKLSFKNLGIATLETISTFLSAQKYSYISY